MATKPIDLVLKEANLSQTHHRYRVDVGGGDALNIWDDNGDGKIDRIVHSGVTPGDVPDKHLSEIELSKKYQRSAQDLVTRFREGLPEKLKRVKSDLAKAPITKEWGNLPVEETPRARDISVGAAEVKDLDGDGKADVLKCVIGEMAVEISDAVWVNVLDNQGFVTSLNSSHLALDPQRATVGIYLKPFDPLFGNK